VATHTEVGDGEVLFHVVMDDGDEEDLEQYEVDEALAIWRSTAEGVRTLRAEAAAAEAAWRRRGPFSELLL